ncbi:MAG: hypothetical protein DI498_00555 [Paracoccus denitrificans]|nr:MAG: hypothetical protein DI498_00555 [Paracoccus denitrificans]PZO86257.1 MAG: hypothetical protein DI633_00555 [Paracoccus denitrificans]
MLIITGSDDNYVPGVMVLIASAAFHNPSARFAVLDMGISPANRERIDRLGKRLGVEVQRVEVKADAFSNLRVARKHLTRSTYLRLLIPGLFPDEDRVIYMDCDMVVTDNLSALDNAQLADAVVAAVPCMAPMIDDLAATKCPMGQYVNAGLLVMNLPVWRAEGVAQTCMALLSDPANPLIAEDQSAINIAARSRVRLLEPRFNVYTDPAAFAAVEAFPDRPAVLHYVVNGKPWTGPATMGQIWQFHADRIADLMPPPRRVTFSRRLSRLNTLRKRRIGVLLGKPKYRLRQQVVARMNATASRYLAAASKLP